MASLQGPVISPSLRGKQNGVYGVPTVSRLLKGSFVTNKLSGLKGFNNVSPRVHTRNTTTLIRCSFSSSSNGNDRMYDHFNENDADYVNSSILEAVEVKSGPDDFIVKMRDGRNLRCVYNCPPRGGYVPNSPPHPAIVLKMEDGSGLLLPIIVLEMPSMMLMAAIRNVKIVRPTIYHVVMDMVEKMGYMVKLVRVTKRVHEAYFAELYLTKLDNEAEFVSFDLRPSDAINIAVRCKAPIQVNKYLAYSDGVKVIEPAKLAIPASDGYLFSPLDRPTGQPCHESEEFILLRNMLIAAIEERYKDAAMWRDKLTGLRSKRNWA